MTPATGNYFPETVDNRAAIRYSNVDGGRIGRLPRDWEKG